MAKLNKTFIITAILLFFGLLDSTIFSASRHSLGIWTWMQWVAVGMVYGQFHLLAIWAVMGPGRWLVRWPTTILLNVVSWELLTWRLRDQAGYYGPPLASVFLSYLLVSQTLLLIISSVSGWRLVDGEEAQSATSPQRSQFQILDILKCMAVLSATLAFLKLTSFRLPTSEVSLWNLALLAIVICLLLAAILPCLWSAFAKTSELILIGLLWLLYGGAVTLVWLGGAALLFGPQTFDSEAFWMFYVLFTSQCMTVYLVMLIFRGMGVRLVRLGNSGGQPQAASPEPRPEKETAPASPFDDHDEEVSKTPPS